MNFADLLPQQLLIGLAVSAALGAIAAPLLIYLPKIGKLIQDVRKEYRELAALIVSSLEEAAEAAEAGRPISPAAVKERVAAIAGEAADVLQAFKR